MSFDELNLLPEQASGRHFVPNVLDQILLYATPADSVNCIHTHFQLRVVACKQLHFRLVVPKQGALVLKWPICSGQRWTEKFLSLLKHNVTLKYHADDGAAVTKTVQRFLSGHEAMMLDEVRANLHLYANLTTLLIDLNVKHAELYQSDICGGSSRLRSAASPKKPVYNLRRYNYLLFDWNMSSYVIKAIVNKCASSLLHLILLTPAPDFAMNNRLLRPRLSPQFYKALEFDKLVASVPNLQTLYMPPIREYEKAFESRWGDYFPIGKISTRAWRALHKLPEKERLPHLKRLVVGNCYNLIGKHYQRTTGHPAECGLPDFSTACVIISESLWRLPGAQRQVFPHAALFKIERHACETYEEYFTSKCNIASFGAWTTEKIIDYVNNGRVERFNVLHQIARNEKKPTCSLYMDTGNVNRGLFAPHVQVNESERLVLAYDALITFCRFLASSANRQRLQANLRIMMQFGSRRNEKAGIWSDVRALLRLFAVNNSNKETNMPTEVLTCLRISFGMCGTMTLKEKIDDWQKNADEADWAVCMQQQYKFPKIRLLVQQTIEIERDELHGEQQRAAALEPSSGALTGSDIAYWLKFIQEKMMQGINAFACDAVEACSRRDLSFLFYQNLERCEFNFKVMLRWPDYNEFCQMRDRISGPDGWPLQASMAQLEQRVFTIAFNETNVDAVPAYAKIPSATDIFCSSSIAVPLPALKVVEVNARCFQFRCHPSNSTVY